MDDKVNVNMTTSPSLVNAGTDAHSRYDKACWNSCDYRCCYHGEMIMMMTMRIIVMMTRMMRKMMTTTSTDAG